jgi:hypothetical protein
MLTDAKGVDAEVDQPRPIAAPAIHQPKPQNEKHHRAEQMADGAERIVKPGKRVHLRQRFGADLRGCSISASLRTPYTLPAAAEGIG